MTLPPSAPLISIMIVAYNSASVIRACLESIPAACTQHIYEVLLIDNGDGSTEQLVGQAFPDVRIVPSKGNVGFAAGNNAIAAEARGPYLLLLNPDVEMKPGALDRLMGGAVAHAEAAAWGGVTLDRNDQPDLGNTVHIPSLKEMASRVVGRSIAAAQPAKGIESDAPVEVLSGSFVMFSRAAWDEVGGLDERYFLYCEEVDLFFRLARRGHTFWRIAESRARHDIGHGEAHSPKRELYLNAGVMQFARLHWTKPDQALAFLCIWLSALGRFISGSVLARVSTRAARISQKNRFVALYPNYWRFGYDTERGLLTRLEKH